MNKVQQWHLDIYFYQPNLFIGDGIEFFDVNKDANDRRKARIVLNNDAFNIDALPASGQISFFVEVPFLLNMILDFNNPCLFLGFWILWPVKT